MTLGIQTRHQGTYISQQSYYYINEQWYKTKSKKWERAMINPDDWLQDKDDLIRVDDDINKDIPDYEI